MGFPTTHGNGHRVVRGMHDMRAEIVQLVRIFHCGPRVGKCARIYMSFASVTALLGHRMKMD